MTRAAGVERVERAFEAFNEHDPDGVVAEMADGGTFTDPFQDDPLTRSEFRDSCVEVFEAFPDAHWDRSRMIDNGDGAIAIEATFRGTFDGPLEGIPPTGESVALPAVSMLTVTPDGITDWRDYWDQQTFQEQLGLTFPAVLRYLPRFALWKLRGRTP